MGEDLVLMFMTAGHWALIHIRITDSRLSQETQFQPRIKSVQYRFSQAIGFHCPALVLHPLRLISLSYPTTILLEELNLTEQIIDLVFYMLVVLAHFDQDGCLGSFLSLHHAALVACSLHLLTSFISTQWPDVVHVLLAHPKKKERVLGGKGALVADGSHHCMEILWCNNAYGMEYMCHIIIAQVDGMDLRSAKEFGCHVGNGIWPCNGLEILETVLNESISIRIEVEPRVSSPTIVNEQEPKPVEELLMEVDRATCTGNIYELDTIEAEVNPLADFSGCGIRDGHPRLLH
eukprot:Gb_38591 [translate_table: standard]